MEEKLMTTPVSSSTLPVSEKLTAQKERRQFGSLSGSIDAKKIQLPLAGIDINAKIVNRAASVTIKQKFRNPYKDFLEATYIFPLAGGIAVDRFEMRVGDRILVGQIDERQEARRQYAQAIQSGKRTALLEQERDDVFTVSVGNLVPGEEVEITLTYSERLPYFADGKTELRLPLVVAPRYIPGNPLERDAVGVGVELDTDVVPDASRITPPRLVPGVDADVSLGIEVDLALESGSVFSGLTCSQHATSTSMKDGWISVSLSRSDEILDRDFVLSWRLAEAEIKSRLYLLPDGDAKDQHFGMLSIMPPLQDSKTTTPRDIVFVLDRSGSMNGPKMVSAARACSVLLETLTPTDRFAIAAFDNSVQWLGGSSIGIFYDADEGGLERGHKFLHGIFAQGGTELGAALDAAIHSISNRGDRSRDPIVVLLTDGEIGDESRILKHVQDQAKDVRIFTLGIDTAVNSGFLKRLAQLGRGTCAFVQPGDQLVGALTDMAREIGVPLVTDIELACENKEITLTEMTPSPMPDLYDGRAVTVFFRINGQANKIKVSIKGKRFNGGSFVESAEIAEASVPAIAKLWAKSYVMSLEDKYREGTGDQTKLKSEIVNLAKTHSLLTKFTAFVLVDQEVVNKDGVRREVVQPVHEPAQWEMNNAGMSQQGNASWGAAAGSWGQAPVYGAAPMARRAAPAPGLPAQPMNNPADSWGIDGVSECNRSPSGGARGGALGSAGSPRQSDFVDGRQDQAMGSYTPGSPPAPPPNNQAGWKSAFGAAQDALGKLGKKMGGSAGISSLTPLVITLWQALTTVWSVVGEGKVPRPDDLRRATKDLLDALAKNGHAAELPELERFLRLEVQQLLDALFANPIDPPFVQERSQKCQTAFVPVQTEIRQKLNINGPEPGNFWEATV
jgi:Ca-activated chloride channel homolog